MSPIWPSSSEWTQGYTCQKRCNLHDHYAKTSYERFQNTCQDREMRSGSKTYQKSEWAIIVKYVFVETFICFVQHISWFQNVIYNYFHSIHRGLLSVHYQNWFSSLNVRAVSHNGYMLMLFGWNGGRFIVRNETPVRTQCVVYTIRYGLNTNHLCVTVDLMQEKRLAK